ncbi:MAG: 30S ribosomal protein S16 [Acidimicrobiia bacterium]|nr:30S ribosomal protein S16 [Acidimicrobiia bacterium]
MAVKMRLMRIGKTKQPVYRVVVMDGRKPRDGRYIEQIGRYDPRPDPSLVEIDNDRAVDWLGKGAQPTETVRKLLEISGAFGRHAVASGKVHTVGAAAPTETPVVTDDEVGEDAISAEINESEEE